MSSRTMMRMGDRKEEVSLVALHSEESIFFEQVQEKGPAGVPGDSGGCECLQ